MKNKKMKNKNSYRQPASVLTDKDYDFVSDNQLEKQVADHAMNFAWSRRPIVQSEDKINPDHYKTGGIETFDILRAKLSPTQLAGFCKGNVIKYITRADHKDKVDDLKKCRWYLDKLIEELDGKATS